MVVVGLNWSFLKVSAFIINLILLEKIPPSYRHCPVLRLRVLVLGAGRLNKNLSSSSVYSSCTNWVTPIEFQSERYGLAVLSVWEEGPAKLQAGRSWFYG